MSSGYARLAADLADPFLTDSVEQPFKKEMPQLLAEAQIKIVRYQSIATTDPLVRRIAEGAAESGTAMIQSHETLDAMAHDSGASSFLLGALGLYLGDPTTIISGASGVLAKGDVRQQERIKWAAAFNRARAAQLMLPEAARTYAGPALRSRVIGVDFDESFAGSAAYDAITLTNNSGKELSHCTVLVELRGRDRDTRQNVHYVASWEAGGLRHAQYGIGIESDSGIYGRQTVHGVQQVLVSMWADEESQEAASYRYPGPERDNDIRAILDGKMKVTYRYDAHPSFVPGPSVLLLLTGVPTIPAHRVTLVFHPKGLADAASSSGWMWEQSQWNQNEPRNFGLSGKLKFEPEVMDIVVAFPDSGYKYTRTVTIQQN